MKFIKKLKSEENQEMLSITRKFDSVCESLRPVRGAEGWKLYKEKDKVIWVNPKSKHGSRTKNYYVFNRKDYTKLNILMNRIYTKEKALLENGCPEKKIKDIKRNVAFDIFKEDDSHDQEFIRNLRRAIRSSIDATEKSLNGENFTFNNCFDAWYKQCQKYLSDPKFKEQANTEMRDFFTFNFAFQFLFDVSGKFTEKQEDVRTMNNIVNSLNALVFGNEMTSYRNSPAFVRNCNWTPLDYEQIYEHLDALADWYKNDKQIAGLHPIEASAILHCEFVRFQAFADGNHRTARLVANGILLNNDISPIPIMSDRDKYNEVTNTAIETHEIEDLIDLFYDEIYANAERIDTRLGALTKNYNCATETEEKVKE